MAAVIVTRNRPAMLRKTLDSLSRSAYPLSEILISDDSTDDSTAKMLKAEFPQAAWVQGPRRGLSANRNHAIRAAKADYVLVSDDDMTIDPDFSRAAMERARKDPDSMFFPSLSENGRVFMPNDLDFLGYHTILHRAHSAYHTAHAGCFILPKSIAKRVDFDEVIASYGFEEVDFSYRVAAAGFKIIPIPECVCVHLAPNSTYVPRSEANRLYVTFKRYFFVDKHPLNSVAFLILAIPHHLLSSFRRARWKGIREAWQNLQTAFDMYRQRRRLSQQSE